MTRPAIPPPWLPPRYLASIGPYAVKYVAACPHGRDTEWTAIRDTGTTSRALCGCECEEAA
jgi:hypothetical protein